MTYVITLASSNRSSSLSNDSHNAKSTEQGQTKLGFAPGLTAKLALNFAICPSSSLKTLACSCFTAYMPSWQNVLQSLLLILLRICSQSVRPIHSGSHTQQDHAKPHPGGPGTHIFVAAILTRQQSWSLTHLTAYFVCGTETSAKQLLLKMALSVRAMGLHFADVVLPLMLLQMVNEVALVQPLVPQ